MNFHSKNKSEMIGLRNSKKASKDVRNEPLLFRKEKARVSSEKGELKELSFKLTF